MSELLAVQRRFQALATSGADVLAGLLAGGDLGIYAHAYVQRLVDVLASDHPKLQTALGAERFSELMTGYVRARPPTSFTVRDAGAALADHLDGHPDVPPWAADLARLERALLEVFDGPDGAPLGRAQLADVAPAALPALPLRWGPSSAVVPLAWSVDDLWSALEDDFGVLEPVPGPRTVLVWRRGLAVVHRTLDTDEAALAPAIATGITFADACALLDAHRDGDVAERAIELLVRWLDAEVLRAPEERP